MTSTLTYMERVQRGAALLDEKFPGWIDQTNLQTLDLLDGCRCILGQRFGDFAVGAKKIGHPTEYRLVTAAKWNDGWDARALEELGFFIRLDKADIGPFGMASVVGAAHVTDEYRALTLAWKQYITDRRAAELLAEIPELETANA